MDDKQKLESAAASILRGIESENMPPALRGFLMNCYASGIMAARKFQEEIQNAKEAFESAVEIACPGTNCTLTLSVTDGKTEWEFESKPRVAVT